MGPHRELSEIAFPHCSNTEVNTHHVSMFIGGNHLTVVDQVSY